MAKKTSSPKADDKKVFSFVQEAPLVRQTEQTILNGYQAIEEKEKKTHQDRNPHIRQHHRHRRTRQRRPRACRHTSPCRCTAD